VERAQPAESAPPTRAEAAPAGTSGESEVAPSDLSAERQALLEENQRLQARLAELEKDLKVSRMPDLASLFSWERIQKWLPRALLALTGFGLLFIPVYLVFRERWLQDPNIRDSMRASWCQVDFLCQLALPSYFMAIFPCFVGAIFLFLAVAPANPAAFPSSLALASGNWQGSAIPAGQRRFSRGLFIASGLLTVVSLVLGVTLQRIPGLELVLAILLYLVGRLVEEVPTRQIYDSLKRIPAWLLPLLLTCTSLVLLLRSLSTGGGLLWLYAFLLLLGLIYLLPFRSQLSPAIWLALLALILYSIRINYWQFGIVGDEFDFFTYARDIVRSQGLWVALDRLFWGQAVYGSHPYFSSALQALFMALLGVDSFGWRFGNVFLCALAILFYYRFFRLFLTQRIALLSSALLAGAHYLMTFGKIGYNNLQAYFVMALLLWTCGEAIRTRRQLAYTGLGLAMGACFYVYPAALYLLPLPIILLLFYDPPSTRPALRRWSLTLVVLYFFLLPLLFQPGYWSAKLPGTWLYGAGEVSKVGLGFHFGSNLLYSLFSYLYIPEESHFVVVSYLDLLSALLIPLGIAWWLKLSRCQKFARFLLVGFLVLLFLVGATHDRQFPANTRMFLLLPWWALLAGSGLAWCFEQLCGWGVGQWRAGTLLGLALLAIFSANLYQAYSLTRQRTLGVPDLEKLFLRLMQRQASRPNADALSYLFITQTDWGIDGIRVLRDLYDMPASQAQLLRVAVEPEAADVVEEGIRPIPPASVQRILGPEMLVIIQPWMEEGLRAAVEDQLKMLGKLPCPVQDTPLTPPRFTLWVSSEQMQVCPTEGRW